MPCILWNGEQVLLSELTAFQLAEKLYEMLAQLNISSGNSSYSVYSPIWKSERCQKRHSFIYVETNRDLKNYEVYKFNWISISEEKPTNLVCCVCAMGKATRQTKLNIRWSATVALKWINYVLKVFLTIFIHYSRWAWAWKCFVQYYRFSSIPLALSMLFCLQSIEHHVDYHKKNYAYWHTIHFVSYNS